MNCPRCGAELSAGSAFCNACGAAVGPRAALVTRPGAITALAVLDLVGGLILLLPALVLLAVKMRAIEPPNFWTNVEVLTAMMYAVFGVPYAVAGFGPVGPPAVLLSATLCALFGVLYAVPCPPRREPCPRAGHRLVPSDGEPARSSLTIRWKRGSLRKASMSGLRPMSTSAPGSSRKPFSRTARALCASRRAT